MKTEDKEKKEDELINPPKLRLVKGGKEPIGGDWLTPMSDGTVFLWRERGIPVMETIKVYTTDKGNVKLLTEGHGYHWEIPNVFCANKELLEILKEGEE